MKRAVCFASQDRLQRSSVHVLLLIITTYVTDYLHGEVEAKRENPITKTAETLHNKTEKQATQNWNDSKSATLPNRKSKPHAEPHPTVKPHEADQQSRNIKWGRIVSPKLDEDLKAGLVFSGDAQHYPVSEPSKAKRNTDSLKTAATSSKSQTYASLKRESQRNLNFDTQPQLDNTTNHDGLEPKDIGETVPTTINPKTADAKRVAKTVSTTANPKTSENKRTDQVVSSKIGSKISNLNQVGKTTVEKPSEKKKSSSKNPATTNSSHARKKTAAKSHAENLKSSSRVGLWISPKHT